MKRLFTLTLFVFATLSVKSQIKILEVYGGGGSTATSPLPSFKNDYVLLKNLGTSDVNLTGYSLQYGSATSGVPPATWSSKALLSGIIKAGGCFLIKTSADGATYTGADLPTADLALDATNTTTASGSATAGISLAAANGKVALVNGVTIIDNSTVVVDKLGYGTANNAEGTAIAVLSTTTAARRNNDGATDTNNNSADFTIVTPTPTNCGTIPVQLVDFKAHKDNATTKLVWSTASELNNNRYDIERSTNGKTFDKIGEILGFGNSQQVRNYIFMDEKPHNTVNYYRLRQIDFDGTTTISKTVSVNFDKNTTIKVYPTVATDKINVQFNDEDGSVGLTVTNLLGQVVKSQNVQNTEGALSLNISDLPNGSYILRIVSKSGESTQRFEKQ
jgi:hypothetical protein